MKKGEWFLIVFTLLYVLAFAVYYLSIKNYEFLWYIGVLMFFFILVLATLKRSKFDYFILWGLSLWGLLHMCGGGVIIKGDVLYNLVLIPIMNINGSIILKYDQFVHFFGFGVATLVAWHLLKFYLGDKVNYKVVYPMLVVIGMGLGALNEMVEFTATVIFAGTNVGGYVDNMLDLFFNSLGAIAAVVLIYLRRKNGN